MLVLRSIAILLASAAVAHAHSGLEAHGDTPGLLLRGAAKLEAAFAISNETDRAIAMRDAASLFRRIESLEPNNVAACYWAGMIGWLRCHPARRLQTRPDAEMETIALQTQSVADLKCVVELEPTNHNAMAYLYLCLRSRASNGIYEGRMRDEAEADSWHERALSTAVANHASKVVPYPPSSSSPRMFPPPLLYPRANGAVELIVFERIEKDIVYLSLVNGPNGPRHYSPRSGIGSAVVHFSAVIGKDGTISDLTTISGHPLVVATTLELAKEWIQKYGYQVRPISGLVHIEVRCEI